MAAPGQSLPSRLSVTRRYCTKTTKRRIQLSLIGSRQCAFHRAIDKPCALPSSPPKGGSKREFLPARRYASAEISRRRVSVCLSVCLSHAGIVPKRLNVGSRKQRHVIAQEL